MIASPIVGTLIILTVAFFVAIIAIAEGGKEAGEPALFVGMTLGAGPASYVVNRYLTGGDPWLAWLTPAAPTMLLFAVLATSGQFMFVFALGCAVLETLGGWLGSQAYQAARPSSSPDAS